MAALYVAFFSYTRADDDHDDGLLTAVRVRLEGELRLTLGRRDIEIFQDRDDIEPGDAWEARLQKAIDQAVFLVPVITPSFFSSEFCRNEFMRFWQKSQADPLSARIIPIYWREHFPLESTEDKRDDDLLTAVKSIQHHDWRSARLVGLPNLEMRRNIEALALQIAGRYRDIEANQQRRDRELLDQRRQLEEVTLEFRNSGRIRIDAPIYEGASRPARVGWFKPGSGSDEWFKDFDIAPEMVVVPDTQPFAIARFPVTFSEWDAAQAHPDWEKHSGIPRRTPKDEGWGRGRRPVINVSWKDASAYVDWLSQVSGQPYRLPSEAEWELACRGGTTTRYSFGDEIQSNRARFSARKWGTAISTSEVGSFEPNQFGLYDMHGNVSEWVRDNWYDNDAADLAAKQTPATSTDSTARVTRGGSWASVPELLQSTSRTRSLETSRNPFIGFRVARSA